jgi:hypothetical protein
MLDLDPDGPNTDTGLTIREAAQVTGLSVKALQRRIERGTLRAELVDGVRHIPHDALADAGLVGAEGRMRAGRRASEHDPVSPVARALLRRLASHERRLAEIEQRLQHIEALGRP